MTRSMFIEIDDMRERAERQWAEAQKHRPGDPYRAALLLAAGETFAASGDFDRGDASWALALQEATDPIEIARIRLLQASLGQVRGPEGIAQFHVVAREVEPVLAGDDATLYRLRQYEARAHATEGDDARARESAARALVHAEQAGIDDIYCTYLLANLDLEGAAHVSDVLQRAHELLPRGRGLTAWALQAFAEANAWLERFDQARAFVRQHVALWREAGRPVETELGAIVELWARDPAAAEALARRVVAALEAGGDLGHGAGSLAVLARAVLEQGRRDEVLGLVAKLESWSAPEDLISQAQIRMLRGRASGEVGLLREAVALLADTPYLNLRAAAHLDLHRVTGEGADVAAELYERKGNAAGARLARELAERGE